MNSKINISIIIPTKNPDRRVFRCLDSIGKQNFKGLEVIIMDNSSKIMGVLLSRIVTLKFRLFNEIKMSFNKAKDESVYDAINMGIQKTKGEWIYILGSDDYLISNNAFLPFLDALNSNRSYLIYGNVDANHLGKNYDGPFDLEKLKLKNICQQAVFYHRSIFEKIGYFDLKEPFFADWSLNLKCFSKDWVNPKHIPYTIAKYAAGGISDLNSDTSFRLGIEDLLKSFKEDSHIC
jgi:glycosyltransferase involved in cell wall biosynthesis